MDRAGAHIAAWTAHIVAAEDGEAFRKMAEENLLAPREGSIARYRIRPGELAAWQEAWSPRPRRL